MAVTVCGTFKRICIRTASTGWTGFTSPWVFLTKTAKSQFVSKNSDLSAAPRRTHRGLPPID